MNNKQRLTLAKIFEQPERADIPWVDIEKLFEALGAEVTEGRGSRVRVAFKGRKAVFHRPHPEKETNKPSYPGASADPDHELSSFVNQHIEPDTKAIRSRRPRAVLRSLAEPCIRQSPPPIRPDPSLAVGAATTFGRRQRQP